MTDYSGLYNLGLCMIVAAGIAITILIVALTREDAYWCRHTPDTYRSWIPWRRK